MAKSDSVGGYTCGVCGETYKQISRHYAEKPTHRPTISDEEMDMLRGLLMGDASLKFDAQHPKVVVGVVEKRYLLDLQQSYSHIFNSITHRPRGGNHSDFYVMPTVPHPQFYEFKNWYSSGEKVFPADVELTPTVLKHWYCTDGGLKWQGQSDYPASAIIACKSQDLNRVVQYFEDTPFNPSIQNEKTIYFGREETPTLLGWMGPPPDGFRYKWEWQSNERYTRKKQTEPVTPDHLSGLSEQLVNVARRIESLEPERQQQEKIREKEQEIEKEYEQKLETRLKNKEGEVERQIRSELKREKRQLRNRLIQNIYDELSDLDDSQLKTVNRYGGISQSMLAEGLEINQAQVSNIVR